MCYLLIFLLFTHTAFCEESETKTPVASHVLDGAIPSLVHLSSLPSAYVNGVNVITGDYCECGEDEVVSGPDPYVLGHNFCSSSLDEGNLGSGWNFLHHHLLEVFEPDRIRYPMSLLAAPTLDSYEDFIRRKKGLPFPFPTKVDSALTTPLSSEDDDFSSLLPREVGRYPRPDKAHSPTTHPLFISLYEPTGGRLLFQATYDEYHKHKPIRSFKLLTKKFRHDQCHRRTAQRPN